MTDETREKEPEEGEPETDVQVPRWRTEVEKRLHDMRTRIEALEERLEKDEDWIAAVQEEHRNHIHGYGHSEATTVPLKPVSEPDSEPEPEDVSEEARRLVDDFGKARYACGRKGAAHENAVACSDRCAEHYNALLSHIANLETRLRSRPSEEAKLRRELELRKHFMDRLPLCPDHRDKVAGEPCLKCQVESLRTKEGDDG